MLITVVNDDPWLAGSGLVIAKIWDTQEKHAGDVRFVLGYHEGADLGEKTLTECLVVSSIENIEEVISRGVLDRYDSFMVADRHTWSVITARFGSSWNVLMPLPSIYSERFKIDRNANPLWSELRKALDAADPISFTTLDTLQWCMYNRREIDFPINISCDIQRFLIDIDTKIADFTVLSRDQIRFRMLNIYSDILQVFPQFSIPRNTGPFWVKNLVPRVSQIVNLVKSIWIAPVQDARNFASFAITGKSNSPYALRDWLDFDNTIAEIFEEYRLRAVPYIGALTRSSIQLELLRDTALIKSRVADIMQRYYAIKSGVSTVLNAQRLAYIATGNPDAEYISNIIDIGDDTVKIEQLIKEVLYEHDINISPSINLTIEKKIPCFNMSYITQNVFNGYHRSGWQYVSNHMQLLDSHNGVLMDTYIDRTFHWNHDVMKSLGIIPYTQPWTGFIHHSFLPTSPYNASILLKNTSFIASLAQCQGLFVLSDNLRKWLVSELSTLGYASIDVVSLTHPTETPQQHFSVQGLLAGKRQIVQIGGWLRDSFDIYRMDLANNNPLQLQKAALRGKNMDIYFKPSWFDSELAENRITISKPTLSNKSNYSTSISELINPVSQISIANETDILLKFSSISLSSPICRPVIPQIIPINNVNNLLSISDTTLNNLQALTGGNQFLLSVIDWLKGQNVDVSVLLSLSTSASGSIIVSNTIRDELIAMVASVSIIQRISNDEYDELLASSIVSIHLNDASAVNTINECVVRNTPICVNPLPAVVEILGTDYPLYTYPNTTINLTQSKITDAHTYLQNRPKNKFSIEFFMQSLLASTIGRRCWIINRARIDGYTWKPISPYMLSMLSANTGFLDMTTYSKFMETAYQAALVNYDTRKSKIADLPRNIGTNIGNSLVHFEQWTKNTLSAEGMHKIAVNASDMINNIEDGIGKFFSRRT